MRDCADPLVTAVITTYKRPVNILKRAVRSVLNQTYRNIELIVINDYPQKGTADNIRESLDALHDSRIVYVINERNMGAAASRNAGIKRANGDFISFLDDDDEWLPEKTEKQLSGFTNDRIGMVYSPFYNVKQDGTSIVTVRCTKSGNLLCDMLRTNCVGGASMSVLRRKVFEDCGMFDENFPAIEDYDMWLRVSEKYDIKYFEEPLTRRFIQAESLTANIEANCRAFDLFMEKHEGLYIKHKNEYNYHMMRRINKMLEQRSLSGIAGLYAKGVKAKPVSIYNFTEPCKGIIKLIFRRVRK